MLHGLMPKRNNQSEDSYKALTVDAHAAEAGKSYGSYTLDVNSAKAITRTTNLPDLSNSSLKQVQVDFLLERYSATKGDFVIATANPFFPENLGTPIIDGQYVDALRGRQWISYQTEYAWTPWKETDTTKSFLANFTVPDNGEITLVIDPQTITEYFVQLGLASVVNIDMGFLTRYNKPIYIDLVPVTSSYVVNWPSELLWTNTERAGAPLAASPGTRIRIEIKRSQDGLMLARYELYIAL